MVDDIDLINHIEEVDPSSYVLFTTFTFNQVFFESYIFPHFKDRTLPLVLVDYGEYQSHVIEYGISRYAERKYFIEPIKCPKTFHSKLFLSTNDHGIKLIIGSNNLTPKGYVDNAEMVVPIEIDYDSTLDGHLIIDIIDFLECLKDIIESESHKIELSNIINNIHKQTLSGGRSSWIIHNIKKPLMAQIIDIIGEKILRLYAVSPYFSQDKEFYNLLLGITPSIDIIVQQKYSDLPKHILSGYTNMNFYVVSTPSDRFLHSKILVFETDGTNYMFIGSANFTRSALLSSNNIEMGILFKSNLSVQDLFKNFGKLEHVTLDNIESQMRAYDENNTHIDIYILEAKFADNLLKIRLSENIDPSIIDLYLNDKAKSYKAVIHDGFIEYSIPKEDEGLFNQSVFINVIIADGGIRRKSDYRLVHNPMILPDQFSALGSIDIGSANWVLHIINKLLNTQNFGQYAALLVELDNNDITVDSDRRKKLLELCEGLEHIKPIDYNFTLNDLINKFIVRHRRRLHNTIENREVESVSQIVNSTILTNKLILWSVLHEYQDIFFLREIKRNFESLNDYINVLKDVSSIKIFNESNIKYQVATSIYIIHYLQNKSPKFPPDPKRGFNRVKRVYDESNISLLKKIIDIDNNSFLGTKLDETISEYQEIINFTTNSKTMMNELNQLVTQNTAHDKKQSYKLIII
jgi:HKD family nuclease/antitoxin component of MazEF toxin-antitoxin module